MLNKGDCDDADPELSPGVPETCDGIDNDCSGVVDEYAVDQAIWYPDRDGDGSDSDSGTTSCVAPASSYVGNDDHCDGDVTCCADYDGDGYGSTTLVTTSNSSCRDDGESSNADDCDDTDEASYPAAPEVAYDGVDDDCDGLVNDADPDLAETSIWYTDSDGDGWGDDTPRRRNGLRPAGDGRRPRGLRRRGPGRPSVRARGRRAGHGCEL